MGSNHFFLNGGFIPAKTAGPSMQILTNQPKERPRQKKTARESDSQKRWTIHDRDSWEVLPPATSSNLYPSTSKSSSHEDSSSQHTETKPKGLDRLRSRFPKSQLYIKTGPLASLGNIGSPGRIGPVPVNVNAVVMGPIGCGVSTLIQKFMTGSNDVRLCAFIR